MSELICRLVRRGLVGSFLDNLSLKFSVIQIVKRITPAYGHIDVHAAIAIEAKL